MRNYMPYYVFYYLRAADQLASNLTANICSIWVVQHSILAFDFFSIIIMYIVLTNIWRNKKKKEKKNMQTQLLTGSSETVRLSTKNKLKHLQLTGRKDYLQIFKIRTVQIVAYFIYY